jgi:hypothetical protein
MLLFMVAQGSYLSRHMKPEATETDPSKLPR